MKNESIYNDVCQWLDSIMDYDNNDGKLKCNFTSYDDLVDDLKALVFENREKEDTTNYEQGYKDCLLDMKKRVSDMIAYQKKTFGIFNVDAGLYGVLGHIVIKLEEEDENAN